MKKKISKEGMFQSKTIWPEISFCTLIEFLLNGIYLQAYQIEINGEVNIL